MNALACMQAPAAYAHVRMPVYAHWFRMASVHEIERNANVEFFNGRSSIKIPEKYVEYRNFMVERYRKCPQARLTFLDCRMHLVGDVNAIRRVWTFLDSWGLINFEADPVPVWLFASMYHHIATAACVFTRRMIHCSAVFGTMHALRELCQQLLCSLLADTL